MNKTGDIHFKESGTNMDPGTCSLTLDTIWDTL